MTIDKLKSEQRTIIAQIAELTAAIGKIDLAERLGCTTNDLQTSVVDCPSEKLGHVIGKGGSNIKLLERETGCIVDVDKVGGKVHLRGDVDAIDKAIRQIENITQSIEEEVKLSIAVHSHLFSKVRCCRVVRLCIFYIVILSPCMCSMHVVLGRL